MEKLYKFDLHMHTGETSKCGRIPARTLVDTYHALGYDGIVITDHLHAEYIDFLYCRDDWDTCVDRFLDGYHRAKQRGDEVGLQVVLGCELRFAENDNDYLLYGIDESFLRENPYMFRMGPQAFYEAFHNDIIIIHAHPSRAKNEFVRHDCVHGVELVNSHPEHANYNDMTFELCKKYPHLHRLCGSDVHRKGEEGRVWVEFDIPITDSFQLKSAIERRGYTLGGRFAEDQAVFAAADAYFGKAQKSFS